MGLLRLLLAISVLTAHMKGKNIFGFRLLYGNLAVECFFMISGFYMALVLNEKYNQKGDFLPFLWQRILRLYPVYFVVLALTLVAQGLVSLASGHPEGFYPYWFQYASQLSFTTWCALIGSNLFIVGLQTTHFSGIDLQTGNITFGAATVATQSFTFIPQAWTLDLELSFYLLAPLMVRRCVWIQIPIVAASFALRFLTSDMVWPGKSPWWDNTFFPYELAYFMMGSVAYQIYRHRQDWLRCMNGFFLWFQWVFFFIVLAFSRLPGEGSVRYALFLPLLFFMIPWLFFHTKNNARDRLMGELSYPFYLIHILLLGLMRPWVSTLPSVMQGPLYLTMSLGTAYVIYRLLEQQVDAYRHRLFKKQRRAQAAEVSVASGA